MHPIFSYFKFKQKDSNLKDDFFSIDYKSYPRLNRVKLPGPSNIEISLQEAILKRKSERKFSESALKLKELSTVLFYGAGITNRSSNPNLNRRAQPSGGARYPIEIYICALNISDLKKGIYHYNVLEHSLEFLTECDLDLINELPPNEVSIKNSSALIVFSSIERRSTIKYGNTGLKLALLEAGHISQNIYLISAAIGIKCCAIGSIKNIQLAEEILDINISEESLFYLMALGT